MPPDQYTYHLFEIMAKSGHDDMEQKIVEALKAGHSPLPLFVKVPECKGLTLYGYLKKHGKYRRFALLDLVSIGAVRQSEQDEKGRCLLDCVAEDDDLESVKSLLLLGVPLTPYAYACNEAMKSHFFDYRPGRGELTIQQFIQARRLNEDRKQKLRALFYDQAETTDAESSEAVETDDEYLTREQEDLYKTQQEACVNAFNQGNTSKAPLLVAYRGVHFSTSHFKKVKTRQRVIDTRHEPHTTFSASTLYDAGYDADDEPDEADPKIACQHGVVMAHKARLEQSPDKKERAVASRTPPRERNKIVFDSLFYRFLQAYINSYSSMFLHRYITHNFGFDSVQNPCISMSWIVEKAMNYASGDRFGWAPGANRKDPHYRRFTGKPKHPNLGYVDVYVFDLNTVRQCGYDRYLLYCSGKIKLSSMHKNEAEVIFFSMIGKAFHAKRRIVCAPSYNGTGPVSSRDRRLGVTDKGARTRKRNEFLALGPGRGKDSAYADLLKRVIGKRSTKVQSDRLEAAMRYRLFNRGQVGAYDGGDKLCVHPPGF